MAYTLENLEAQIADLPPGGAVGLPYDTYVDLFPPGEPDQGARERAYNFAKANGCTIDHNLKEQIVFFVKPRNSQAAKVNEHIAEPGDVVFRHACKLGFEGIVSKRLGSPYRSGRSRDWIKTKNPAAPAVKREAEEDWSK
jgi:hypothetical protein